MIVSNKDHYDYFLNKYSIDDSMSVGWGSKEHQNYRFYKLRELWLFDLSQHDGPISILDVGCGLGHILDGESVIGDNKYLGIDCHPGMIEIAKERHPGNTFFDFDLMDYEGSPEYVISSGSFSLRVENQMEYLVERIKKMWSLCQKGMAFNLLSLDTMEDQLDILFYYDPIQVMHECLKITKNIKIDQSYCNHEEFTVFMYKYGV